MHFVKANGGSRAKLFKLKRVTLEAKDSASFEGKVSFAQMTTRRHYPGRHRIEVLVNGVAFARRVRGSTLKRGAEVSVEDFLGDGGSSGMGLNFPDRGPRIR